MKQNIILKDLGEMAYQEAWDYQELLLQKNLRIKAKTMNLDLAAQDTDKGNGSSEEPTTNYLLFVEHPPVYTLGKSGKEEHVLMDEAEREREEFSSLGPTGVEILPITGRDR